MKTFYPYIVTVRQPQAICAWSIYIFTWRKTIKQKLLMKWKPNAGKNRQILPLPPEEQTYTKKPNPSIHIPKHNANLYQFLSEKKPTDMISHLSSTMLFFCMLVHIHRERRTQKKSKANLLADWTGRRKDQSAHKNAWMSAKIGMISAVSEKWRKTRNTQSHNPKQPW